MEPSDEEVVARARTGDKEAFGVLYERNVERIYNYVYYRTGNVHDAEDLTARVFQRAMNHIRSYQERGVPYSAWLYRIAHNLIANWHRDKKRKVEISLTDSPLVAKDPSPDMEVIKGQQRDNLLKIIKAMPEERQTLLILKFVEHLSNAEIGGIMGRSEGAIKSLYHRTLLSLRETLDDSEDFNL